MTTAKSQSPLDNEYPLDIAAERSFTLSARHYWDPQIHELEKERIHYRNWHFIGHVCEMKQPGDYVTGWIADQHVFAIRGRDGQLRGFYNVCQHRAHELLPEGSGHIKAVMTCPYHAWAYDTEGALRTARNCDDVPGFDKSDFGLKPIRVEALSGLVFVNMDLNAQSLAEQAPQLASDFEAHVDEPIDVDKICRVETTMACNWKAHIDNSIECYHCESAHPSFCTVIAMDSYRSENFGNYQRHTSVSLDDGAPFVYWHLWPTHQASMQKRDDGIFHMYGMRILGPEQIILISHAYGPPDMTAEERERIRRYDTKNTTMDEDISLCEAVQRGLRSHGYSQGRFIVKEDDHISEHLVHAFHLKVAQALEL